MLNETESVIETCFDAKARYDSGNLKHLAVPIGGYATGLVVLIGLVNNTLALNMIRKFPKNTFFVYLSALTVCDSVLMLATLGLYSLNLMLVPFEYRVSVMPYVTIVSYGLCTCAMGVGAWLNVLITTARFHAVWRPLQHLRSSFTVHPHRVTASVALVAAVFQLPAFFELTTADCWDIGHKIMREQVYMRAYRQNMYYQFYYRFLFDMIAISLLPFIFIIVLSAGIISKIHQSHKRKCSYAALRTSRSPNQSMKRLSPVDITENQALASTNPNPTSDKHSTTVSLNNVQSSTVTVGLSRSASKNLQLPEPFNLRRHSGNSTTGSAAGNLASSSASLNKQHQRQEFAVDLTILFVAIKFLLSHFLPPFLNFAEYLNLGQSEWFWFDDLVEISNFLMILHSATNAVVYLCWKRGLKRSDSEAKRTRNTTCERHIHSKSTSVESTPRKLNYRVANSHTRAMVDEKSV